MRRGPGQVVPFRFDLSALVRRSVATLYSHLVTRPTGQALRMGIESQIGELGAVCVSVLDFGEVVVLDYSCADEAVAKLLERYGGADRPAEAYFIARGVGEQHRETIETVLARKGLVLVAEVVGEGFTLLGDVPGPEMAVWRAIEAAGQARAADLLGAEADDEARRAGAEALDRLVRWRVVVRQPGTDDVYHSLSSLLARCA